MSDEGGGLLQIVSDHWQKLAGGAGILGAVSFLATFGLKRAHEDKHAYRLVVDYIDRVSDALDAIVGDEETRAADTDRCRNASSQRRRAGEAINDLHRYRKFDPFIPKLKGVDRALREVEDSVGSKPHVGRQTVRTACEEALSAVGELRRFYKAKSDDRMSVRLLGRAPSKSDDKGT